MSRISLDGASTDSAPSATPTPIVQMPVSETPTATAITLSKAAPPVQPPTKRLTQDQIDQYGAKSIAAMGGLSDGILKASRAGDMDVMGKNLGNLLVEAQKFDPKHLAKSSGFLGGIMSFGKTELQKMRNNFDSVYGLVEQMTHRVDGDIKLFQGRINDLKALWEGAEKSYYELVREADELELRIAQEEAFPPQHDDNDAFSAAKFQQWQSMISFAKKRHQELKLQQLLAQQTGQQVVMMATNARALVQKFSEVLTFTIPNLKTAFNLAVQNIEQAKSAEFADTIDALNNKTIMDNAKQLGANTTKIQTALTRNSVELSTLQFNQQAIIDAMNETKRIHAEMAQRIANERPQIEAMSKQLVELQTSR